MLSPRGRKILFSLVSEYLLNGEPVSSQTLAKGTSIDLSSASIRAVFLELEGLGYVHKPHTSAGRIPTEKGLRAFVDALISSGKLSEEVRAKIDQRFTNVAPGVEAAIKHTVRVLAELTGTAAVVVSSPSLTWKLRELRFIHVRPHEVLAVIVGENGAIQNRILRIEKVISPAELERANNLVHSIVEGKTLQQVRQRLADQLETERARFDPLMRLALTLGECALVGAENDSEITIEGHSQLIVSPEFADIDRARQAMCMLEDRERLVELLDRTLAAPGIQVRIGAEDQSTEPGDLSVVAAPFEAGSLGVIGPTRMDYGSVVPAVRYTADILDRIIQSEPGKTPRNNST